MKRENPWRLRQIVMDAELVNRVCDWHAGQTSATYALCSTGRSHLVSLSMIDAALDDLGYTLRQGRAKMSRKDRRHLNEVIGDLQTLRQYWRESSAKEAGMEDHDEGYDTRDYGLDAEEEVGLEKS